MSLISIAYVFSAGTTIISSQVNANNTVFLNAINGGLDNTNLTGSAGITGANLNLSSPGAIGGTTPSTGAFSTLKVGTTHQGDILYDNGTTLTRLTPGTNGQFLQTQGTSANPQWASQSMPALTPISNTPLATVATSGSISITDGNVYFVTYNLYNLSGSDTLILRFNGSSGSNYVYIGQGMDLATNSAGFNSEGTTSIALSQAISQTSTQGIMGSFYIQKATAQVYNIWGQSSFIKNSSGFLAIAQFTGNWSGSATVTSFALLTLGGATMSGYVNLYQLVTG